jgi:hypothetical protein
MIEVVLSPQEMYQSGLVGFRRNLEAICRGRKPRFPERQAGELFGYHILGAMAELAVAKYLDKYWSFHVNRFASGDVGDYEVRYSQRSDLKIRERDKGTIISVSGYPPIFLINGFIDAIEAKRIVEPSSPRSGPPAYFLPHKFLHEIKDLSDD